MRLKNEVKTLLQSFGAKNRDEVEQLHLQIKDLVTHLGQSETVACDLRSKFEKQVSKTVSELKQLQ